MGLLPLDTPKPRPAEATADNPVLAGEEFITFQVKDQPPKIEEPHLKDVERYI